MLDQIKYHTCLAAAALLLLNLLAWLRHRAKAKAVAHQRFILLRDIASLRREAEKLNTPSTFAKCAKFQRMANVKEKELAQLQDASRQPMDVLDKTLLAVKVAVCVALAAVCWGKPVAHVSPAHVWPMHRLLGFSYSSLPALGAQGGAGAVYMLPWLLLCDRVSKLVARVALPLPRVPSAQVAGQGVAVVDRALS